MERVVVADRDDSLGRVCDLTRLNQVSQVFSLRATLGANAIAVNRIVNRTQGTQVVDDDREAYRNVGESLRHGHAYDERRTIIQEFRRAVIRVDVGRRLAELRDIHDRYARGLDEEADIYAADIIAFDQIGLIVRVRLSGSRRVSVDLISDSLQRR